MTIMLSEYELLTDYTNLINEYFSLDKALRIGESAVASTKVHGTVPGVPGTVFVMCLEDAGKMFYGIPEEKQIVHLDLFHEIAELEPKTIADHIIDSLEMYKGWTNRQELVWQCEHIDLQTAKGGGKLSGLLNYGKTNELKKSHLNHVHLAVKLEPDLYFLLFYIVNGVEKGVMNQGFGLKKVESIKYQMTKIKSSSPPVGQNVPTDSRLSVGKDFYQQSNAAVTQKNYPKLIELVEELEDYQEVEQILAYFLRPVGSYMAEIWADERFVDGQKIIKTMLKHSLIRKDRGIYQLTEVGKTFSDWFWRFRGELKLEFNKLVLQSVKTGLKLNRTNYSAKTCKKGGGRRDSKLVISADALGWIEDIASAETARNMIKNYKLNNRQILKHEDVMIYSKKKIFSMDVCLVLDGSISMAGKPIQAAKSFSRYVAANNKGKISVVVFQEDKVTAKLRFTKNTMAIKNFLAEIRPRGLTPLAAGLEDGLRLCQTSHLNNPLLLLITDGQPNVGKWTNLPENDALRIAKEIAKSQVKFCCIALPSEKEFLQKLTKEAGGVLYLVDEIDRAVLTAIFKREKQG